MDKAKQSKITADIKKNRLHVILIGPLSKKILEGIYTEVRFCVADLSPGFAVITDFTQCGIGYLSGLGLFAQIREYLSSKEVGPVIRIISKKDLVFKQISKISDRKKQYQPIYVKTLAEAEQKLIELGHSPQQRETGA